MKYIMMAMALIALLSLYSAVSALLDAQAELNAQWVHVNCLTNDCIANTLNKLPVERAAEAKLTTWQDTTYVWFRK